jgi:hypothetical protein
MPTEHSADDTQGSRGIREKIFGGIAHVGAVSDKRFPAIIEPEILDPRSRPPRPFVLQQALVIAIRSPGLNVLKERSRTTDRLPQDQIVRPQMMEFQSDAPYLYRALVPK